MGGDTERYTEREKETDRKKEGVAGWEGETFLTEL